MQEYILNKEEKEIVGKLIEIRRKGLCDSTDNIPNPYTVNSFLMGKNGKIIDEKSYRKLKQGITLNDDEMYDVLLDKLGVKYYKNVELEETIREIFHTIYNAIYWVDENKLEEECLKAEEVLKGKKGYIVYEELNYIVDIIKNYALANQYLKSEQYQEVEQYVGLFGREIDEMLLYVLNRYNLTFKNTYKEILEWQNKYVNLYKNSFLLLPYYIGSLVNLSEFEKVNHFLNCCYENYKKENNTLRYIQVKSYELQMVLEKNNDIHLFVEQFKNNIELCKSENINANFIGGRYFTMATQLMMARYYSESIEMFKMADEYLMGNLDRVYIFMQYCYDCIERNTYKIIMEKKKEENELDVIWNYYAMRNNEVDNTILEKYIKKLIMKNSVLKQKQYYMIMKREIFELVKISKHYSLYYLFIAEYFDNEF